MSSPAPEQFMQLAAEMRSLLDVSSSIGDPVRQLADRMVRAYEAEKVHANTSTQSIHG